MCTRAPTWAQEPTSACESIIVPSPTQAPMFTYIGGMQMTPRARYAPSRIVEPPGTMRMPDCAPARNFLTGSVSLSKNCQTRSTWVSDMSTTSPNLKPRRIPCFTQVLTRQPIGLDASGSAARTSPADNASRSFPKTTRAARRSASAPAAASSLISDSSIVSLGSSLPPSLSRGSIELRRTGRATPGPL